MLHPIWMDFGESVATRTWYSWYLGTAMETVLQIVQQTTSNYIKRFHPHMKMKAIVLLDSPSQKAIANIK